MTMSHLCDTLFAFTLEVFGHGIVISLDHNNCSGLSIDGEFSWCKIQGCGHLIEYCSKFF